MSKKFESDTPTIDEIMARRKPRTKTVWISMDADLHVQIEELERQLRAAERDDEREHRTPVAPGIQQRLEQLREDAEDAAVGFKFQQLPKREFRRLKDEHPDPDGKMAWDEDTFAPALIAACAVAPAITLEQATTICSEWGEADYVALFMACIQVNAEDSRIPFSARPSVETPD